ncbi:MAG: hypothetical protein H6Q17_2101 [Bacteroidetes bacterium]|nr:hypothetical protein [Bacteroidota bacterium]
MEEIIKIETLEQFSEKIKNIDNLNTNEEKINYLANCVLTQNGLIVEMAKIFNKIFYLSQLNERNISQIVTTQESLIEENQTMSKSLENHTEALKLMLEMPDIYEKRLEIIQKQIDRLQ